MSERREKIKKALGVLGDLYAIGKAIADALAHDDIETVDKILAPEAHTSIARAAAYARAAEKFDDA